jgi:hypothetical protein
LKKTVSHLRQEVERRLPDDVSKDDFLKVLSPKWFGAYKVRALVAPEKAKA